MTCNFVNGSSREARLNDVLLGYVEALQEGRAVDQGQLLAAHPDLRDELKAFFASHDRVERIAARVRAAGKAQSPVFPGSADIGQLGDFRLLREVGRGGMGVVYEAEQLSLRRRVALKVLPFAAAIDPRQLQRFQNEALAAAHLRHENIVPVYAVGSERGVHYYAMQFVDGESLASLIEELRRGRRKDEGRMTNDEGLMSKRPSDLDLPRQEDTPPRPRHSTLGILSSLGLHHSSFFRMVADLGRQAALALEHAHERGVVHRDVKPANLLLDGQGQLWVTDFGLAQCSNNAGLTLTGELLGTMRYASPEQVLARRGLVDQRTDIYSLGATLYELLTLRPIFDGRDRHELLQQIADAEPRPLRSIDKTIPEELETVILKAVAKEPSERYATAQELADDLQRFREDRPIRARRPSALEKATKWARRHKGAVASALVFLLLFAAGMSVTTLLVANAYERERTEREQAERSFREAREAVDQFAKIGEEELAGNPFLEATRRRMLLTALDYYRNFIEQRRDDPFTYEELETSRDRVAKIVGELTTLMGLNQYALVKEKAIQDLLQLSDKQRNEVTEIDGLWSKMVGEFHGSPQEWERRRLQLAQEQKRQVEKILDDNQLRRFRQIALQSLGPAVFREPEVITTLNLSAAQRERIRGIEANTVFIGAVHQLRSGPISPKPPPQVLLSSYGELRTSALARIQQEVLTPEQVQRWKELTGEPVDANIFGSERKFFTQELRPIGAE